MASYRVEVTAEARKDIWRLPGYIRQRVVRAIQSLKQSPAPNTSQALDIDVAGVQLDAGMQLRRIRLDMWRIVYLVEDEDQIIWVLAIRKRPPYQYDDLEALLRSLN